MSFKPVSTESEIVNEIKSSERVKKINNLLIETRLLISDEIYGLDANSKLFFFKQVKSISEGESKIDQGHLLRKYLKNFSVIEKNYQDVISLIIDLKKNQKGFSSLSKEVQIKLIEDIVSLKAAALVGHAQCDMGAMYGTVGCANYANNLISQGYPQSYANQAMTQCITMVGVYHTICNMNGGVWPVEP